MRNHGGADDVARPLSALREAVDRSLAATVGTGARAAFVNFPNQENIGDAALWLGARAALRRLGVRITYQCDQHTYDPEVLRRSLRPGDVILINGGGNFGDLWKGQQQVREHVLAEFQGVRTVQLPQSVFFSETAQLNRMRRLCERHRDLTIMVREQQSFDFVRQHFDVPVRLCPDTAFGLEPLRRREDEIHAVLVLLRTDKESLGWERTNLFRQSVDGVAVMDWVDPTARRWTPVYGRVVLRLAPAFAVADTRLKVTEALRRRVASAMYRPAAVARLERGRRILSGARAVVTDRLHGHVLSTLMGQPNVLLDNVYGKNRSLFRTWTADLPWTHWAESMEEALAIAHHLPSRVELR